MNYADSCYNSRNFNKQKQPVQDAGLLNKIRHRGQILPFSETNESIATSSLVKHSSKFNNSDPNKFYWNHEKLEPYTLVSWMQVFSIFAMIAHGVIFYLSPISFIFLIIILLGDGGFDAFTETLVAYLYILIPSLIIEYVPVLVLNDKRLKNNLSFFIRKNYTLNRQTGMVTVYGSGNKIIYEYPFLEFDCIFQSNPNHQGILSYRLMLVHRYSGDKHVVDIGSEVGLHAPVADYHRFWNSIQRFMDVSQPLPDIPMLEPFRNLDPVTAEHDKRAGRSPKYWRSMNDQEYMATLKEIAKKQEKLPASGLEIDIFQAG